MKSVFLFLVMMGVGASSLASSVGEIDEALVSPEWTCEEYAVTAQRYTQGQRDVVLCTLRNRGGQGFKRGFRVQYKGLDYDHTFRVNFYAFSSPISGGHQFHQVRYWNTQQPAARFSFSSFFQCLDEQQWTAWETVSLPSGQTVYKSERTSSSDRANCVDFAPSGELAWQNRSLPEMVAALDKSSMDHAPIAAALREAELGSQGYAVSLNACSILTGEILPQAASTQTSVQGQTSMVVLSQGRAPCIFVTFRSLVDQQKARALWPHGLNAQGILLRF